MAIRFATILQIIISLVLSGCFLPYTTCITCSYYKLPENASQLACYYVKSANKKNKSEFCGKQRVYLLKDKNYILHYKQCTNTILYNIKIYVFEMKKDKKTRTISEFSCLNSLEAYSVFNVEFDGEYYIEVNTERKINVHLILGEIK